MSSAPPLPTAAPPATALHALTQRLLLARRGSLLFVGALCLGIAVVLTAMDGGSFGIKLLYSCCIGACCLLASDAARVLRVLVVERWRRWRGLGPLPAEQGRGWRGVAPAALAAIFIGAPLGHDLADLITGQAPRYLWDVGNWGNADIQITLAFGVLGTLLSIFAISTLERLAGARAQAEAAQRLALENQLQLLQSQLEPHMLFNTLANLRVLIGIDAARAQAMLDRLIAFLRTTLNASRQPRHALAAEFAHLDDYLALMAIRMGARLAVRLELPAELQAVPVPPLLLQPLVENAVKHGLEPKVEGGRIEVSARRHGAVLELAVRDTGVGLNAAGAVGGSRFGLEQVRARLAALYGEHAALALHDADDGRGGVLAMVHLPLEQPLEQRP